MEQIYQVQGILNEGFVGQITYTVCLEKTYDRLDIEFSFDKRKYEPSDITDELITRVSDVCREKYGLTGTREETVNAILGEMKTEIHTLAMLNDSFIGCVHKQLLTRHMSYDKDNVSEGCIPVETFSGVLKVTLLVFNVIKDDTHYTLTVRAGQD